MADFYWKRHDTAPTLQVALTDGSGNKPPGTLVGGSVKFIMRATGSSVPKVNATASIDDATNWLVSYSPIAADTDTSGDYQAEFQVTYASTKKQTFPDPDYLLITITDDLDNA